MADPEVIKGINLWLAARKLEAVKLEKDCYDKRVAKIKAKDQPLRIVK